MVARIFVVRSLDWQWQSADAAQFIFRPCPRSPGWTIVFGIPCRVWICRGSPDSKCSKFVNACTVEYDVEFIAMHPSQSILPFRFTIRVVSFDHQNDIGVGSLNECKQCSINTVCGLVWVAVQRLARGDEGPSYFC